MVTMCAAHGRRGHARAGRPDPPRLRPGRRGPGRFADHRQAAYEVWRAQHPDPDDPDKGFGERFLQLDTTMDNAGGITGNLTPECSAAVQAVLEALGKKRGSEDDRTAAQRFHDTLQEAWVFLWAS